MNHARAYSLNMPNMNITGLSENWLFKEVGDIHWAMICAGLGANSSDLVDEGGNRLYATFTRLRMQCTGSLTDFRENEKVEIAAEESRFGAGLFFSQANLTGAKCNIRADVMSAFSRRDGTGNTSLLKGQPLIPDDCAISELAAMPDFGNGYRAQRNQNYGTCIFETAYDIHPYYDINGVGLLYFASYPMINDFCEMKFFSGAHKQVGFWPAASATASRDVHYFSNCDPDDGVIYRLHQLELTDAGATMISTLSRRSDGARMADLITTKRRLPPA